MVTQAIAEKKAQELEAYGTSGSIRVATTALSLVLLLAQYSFSPVSVDDNKIRSAGTEGTGTRALSLEITIMDLFGQMNRIYDDLLKNQTELDNESKSALYANLWDLYT